MKPVYAGILTVALGAAFATAILISPKPENTRAAELAKPADVTVSEFSAEGTDGKTYTLADLTKDGPVVLYLISTDCPVNEEAAPYYERIASAYGDNAKFVGIAVGSPREVNAWREEQGVDYLVLADPEMKIVSSLGATYSPWAVQTDGKKVLKVWEGSSERHLSEINDAVAKASGQPVQKLSFAGVPDGGG